MPAPLALFRRITCWTLASLLFIAGYWSARGLRQEGFVPFAGQSILAPPEPQTGRKEPSSPPKSPVDWASRLVRILKVKSPAKEAALRDLIRQLAVEQISECVAAAQMADPALLSACMEAWAERSPHPALEFARGASTDGTVSPSVLDFWMRGFTRHSSAEAESWLRDSFARGLLPSKNDLDSLSIGFIHALAETEPARAWSLLADPAHNWPGPHGLTQNVSILRHWAAQDPNAAIAAWKELNGNALLLGAPENTATADEIEALHRDCLPALLEGLGQCSPEVAMRSLAQLQEWLPSSEITMDSLVASHPDWWLAEAVRPESADWVKSSAASWASKNPCWVLDNLPPSEGAGRNALIVAALRHDDFSELYPFPMAKTPLDWMEELPAESLSTLTETLQAAFARDPARAEALAAKLPQQERKKALIEGWAALANTEPRLAEKLLTQSPDPETRLLAKGGYLIGVHGIFNSPHDAICRAASLTDPEMRHQSFVAAMLSEDEPEAREAILPWLQAMPAGTVDPALLRRSVETTMETIAPLINAAEPTPEDRAKELERIRRNSLELQSLIDRGFPPAQP